MLIIRQVATESIENKPSKITRVNRQRIATIGAEPNGVPLGTAIPAVTRAMDGLGLPTGARRAFAGLVASGEAQAARWLRRSFRPSPD